MAIRVLVNGYSGQMGPTALEAVEGDEQLTLAGKTRRGDDLAAAIGACRADVVLDFTSAATVFAQTQKIIEAGASPVIGTSGLVEDQIETLGRRCAERNLGGLVVANFSISAVLMMRYAQDAIRHLQQAEIIELHHDQKEDSPSGTALRTSPVMGLRHKNVALITSWSDSKLLYFWNYSEKKWKFSYFPGKSAFRFSRKAWVPS